MTNPAPKANILTDLQSLQKQGRWQECVHLAESFLQAKGSYPAVQYMAGTARLELGHHAQAAHHLEAVLKEEKSQYALIALSSAYISLNRPADAVPLLEQALTLNPNSAEALCFLGVAHMELSQYAQAREYLLKSKTIKPGEQSWFNLGILGLRTANIDEALQCFTKAVEANERNPQNWEYLGQTYFLQGQLVHALMIFQKLALENPNTLRYLNQLTGVLREFNPVKYEPVYRQALEMCLAEKRLSLENLSHSFLTIMRLDPAKNALRDALSAKDYAAFANKFTKTALKEFADPLMVKALASFIIRDYEFERVMTYLRRYLLENNADAMTQRDILGGLAAQCFLTEYVYAESAQEKDMVTALQNSLSQQDEWTDQTITDMLLMSCYRPLIDLADNTPLLSEKDIAAARDKTLAHVLDVHVTELRRERAIAKTIPTLSMSDNDVSQKVRDMYEENPYPRWENIYVDGDSLNPYVDLAALRAAQPNGTLEVLNAGCGTGRHMVISQGSIPNANFLGVDLSRASLSYARKKCDEYGIANVTFMQGDILKLGELDRQFDIVESAGVLHHMADPMAGWRVLTGLLKPGGYMRIGLYSELARQHVVACRNFIAEKGYASDIDGIRACRAAIMALSDLSLAKQIVGSNDFYSTSLCRDLIFHVQEHRFTLPQIKACLQELNLECVSFNISKSRTMYEYRTQYPDDNAMASIDHWHEFEVKNPGTFGHMYQFWCRKPQ